MQMIKVILINRRAQDGQFSIERVFKIISTSLRSGNISIKNYTSPMYSKGIFKRLYNIVHVALTTKGIRHIAGDVTYLALFLSKKSLIVTFHDIYIYKSKKGISKFIIGFFWYKIPLKKAKYITTISEFTKNELIKHFNIDQKKIHLISNPLPIGFKKHQRLSIDPLKKINILQIGTKKNKNLLRVIDALNKLSPKYKFQLNIVGKQPDYIDTANLNFKIKIQSQLNEIQLIEEYVNSDLLIFASTYEGFGLPIIEAQAIGRPVITSSIEPMKSVAGNAAMLVNPYSVDEIACAVEKIVIDKVAAEKLVLQGLENAKSYKIDIIASKYRALYEKT